MIKKPLKALNRRLASHFGVMLVRTEHLYPWQRGARTTRTHDASGLPPGAVEFLRPDNPRLVELQQRYRAFDQRVTAPFVWVEGKLAPEDLLFFRGDNPYVWQSRDTSDINYALAYYYSRATDGEVLARLDEDGAFGAHTYLIDSVPVSRDLLDSVQEIGFLKRHLRMGSEVRGVLDIGAGYGRLVHRLAQAFPGQVTAHATDGYAPSTFLCEYYLRHRNTPGAQAVPLDEVEGTLGTGNIQLATNVHSFSECSSEAIEWWTSKIASARVQYLMVVPNRVQAGSMRCLTNDGRDMEEIFERHGYRATRREPRYADPVVQRYGVDPSYLTLFERAA